MSDLIDAVIRTRKIAEQIAIKSLEDIAGISEAGLRDKIISEVKNHTEIFSEGYYSPPPLGIGVIFNEKPFDRFKYDSLRNPDFWPKENSHFKQETVGMVYFSPVDRKTGMIGDIGFTFYLGDSEEIKQHIKNCYSAILDVAKHAEVGMTFSGLCSFASSHFANKFKMTKLTASNSDPNQSINLGHTIPGSFEKDFVFGDTFEKVKETITKNRVPFIDTENFEIPQTCAFTVESRLEDLNNPNLPSVYFHFIVCFNKGEKTILENFDEIFTAVGMDYMKS